MSRNNRQSKGCLVPLARFLRIEVTESQWELTVLLVCRRWPICRNILVNRSTNHEDQVLHGRDCTCFSVYFKGGITYYSIMERAPKLPMICIISNSCVIEYVSICFFYPTTAIIAKVSRFNSTFLYE